MTEPNPTKSESEIPPATRYQASIDARLLYWTRLPPDVSKLDAQQQNYRFERVLPVPIESLHIVRARLRDGSSLLAGIEPERLRSHLAERQDVSPDTWALVPDRIPDHLTTSDAPANVTELNLLQDQFEPPRRQRTRKLRDLVIGVGLAFALILVLVGIERRVTTEIRAADAMRVKGQELLTQALGPSSGRLSHAAVLTQELRRLELAARSSSAKPLDTANVLQQLWAAWPADIHAQIETISLAPDRLVIRGSVPTLSDAQRVAKACPSITTPETTFKVTPLQAEQTSRGAVFLLTWYAQSVGQKGGSP
ncbi:MAG: hypothetical protein AAB263_20180 [Planctomycetota bacterium]